MASKVALIKNTISKSLGDLQIYIKCDILLLSYVGGGVMRFDTDSIIQTKRALNRGDVVPFTTQEEMVTEVAKQLTVEHKDHLEFWMATAMDEPMESKQWQEKLRTELEPYYEAVRAELESQVKACEQLPFYRKHIVEINSKKKPEVISAGLRAIGSDVSPSSTFPINVRIILDVRKNQVRKYIYP